MREVLRIPRLQFDQTIPLQTKDKKTTELVNRLVEEIMTFVTEHLSSSEVYIKGRKIKLQNKSCTTESGLKLCYCITNVNGDKRLMIFLERDIPNPAEQTITFKLINLNTTDDLEKKVIKILNNMLTGGTNTMTIRSAMRTHLHRVANFELN